MGFSCRREPRVGWLYSLADGVSLFSTFTCPQSRVCLTVVRNGFSVGRSQISGWVQNDSCRSWAHPDGEERDEI